MLLVLLVLSGLVALFDGQLCQACMVTPNVGKKRLAEALSLRSTKCPIKTCGTPAICSVQHEISYFTFQGKQCPGCRFCPAGKEETSQS